MNFLKRWWSGEDADKPQPKTSTPAKSSAAQSSQRPEPLLLHVGEGRSGGVQGLGWYTKSLRVDDEGDVATEFLEEHPSPRIAGNSGGGSGGPSAAVASERHDAKRQKGKAGLGPCSTGSGSPLPQGMARNLTIERGGKVNV